MMKIPYLLSSPYLFLGAVLLSAVSGSALLSSWFGAPRLVLKPSNAMTFEDKTASIQVAAESSEELNSKSVCCESDCDICESSRIIVSPTAKFWQNYHAHMLPLAVGFFMLCLSGWSLLGVENLAAKESKQFTTTRAG
jgi:hypothetical protein